MLCESSRNNSSYFVHFWLIIKSKTVNFYSYMFINAYHAFFVKIYTFTSFILHTTFLSVTKIFELIEFNFTYF